MIQLDLTHTFEAFIVEDLIKAMEIQSEKNNQVILEYVAKDKFALLEPNFELFKETQSEFGTFWFDEDIPVPVLSGSAYDFYQVLTGFGSEIGLLLSFEVYNTVVKAIGGFFKAYMKGLQKAINQTLTMEQVFAQSQ